MRVAIVSTYPPRACGIGTFSRDLRDALLADDGVSAVELAAIVRDEGVEQEPEVVVRILQDQGGDYAAAARVLDRRGDDVVLIQHEYGIFGGPDGAHVLSLARELRQPMVLTLHTVLASPSVRRAETLRALCSLATLVCVFTETAKRMVVDLQLVPPERVRVLPHGAPEDLRPPDGERRLLRLPRRGDGEPPHAIDASRQRALHLRSDLARQGNRDRDRGDARHRRAPPEGAVPDRRTDPPRGVQRARRGVPALAGAPGRRPQPG